MKIISICISCIMFLTILIFIGCEKNHNPEPPTTPTGLSQGIINTNYDFTSSAVDADDDSLTIRFDWGDGDTSDWSSLVASGQEVTGRHSWSTAGTFEIKAQTRDYYLNLSNWSFGNQITISSNMAPGDPYTPMGSGSGFVNLYYSFTTTASDPNQDSISYQFDWGNGVISRWSSFFPSGESITMIYTWTDSGSYLIRARAKDTKGSISGWSFGHQIAIQKSGAQFPNHIVATITVGSNPVGITALPNDNFVYVTNNNASNVSVIRTSDNTVVATVPVQNEPWGITALPNGNYVYVTNSGSNTVSVIRASDNTVTATIQVGQYPSGIAALSNSNYVYVANMGSDNVSIIRTSDNTVTATIPVGNSPTNVCALPNGDYVYVANEANNNISVIRTSDNAVIASVSIQGTPHGLTASPSGDYIFVAHGTNNVSIIRTSDNTVIATITVGNGPAEMTVLPNGNYVYVTNRIGNNVTVFNALNHSVVASIPVGNNPIGITTLTNGNYVYVVNNITNVISVIAR